MQPWTWNNNKYKPWLRGYHSIRVMSQNFFLLIPWSKSRVGLIQPPETVVPTGYVASNQAAAFDATGKKISFK